MIFNPIVLAVPGVQSLKPYQPGKGIAELERELGVSNIVKLASNENPRTVGSPVWDAIKEIHLILNFLIIALLATIQLSLLMPAIKIFRKINFHLCHQSLKTVIILI